MTKRDAQPEPPRLPTKLSLLNLTGDVPEDFGEYCGGRIAQLDWAQTAADHVTFQSLDCRGINLAATQFLAPRINDVVLKECDLANADWPRLIVHRSKIEATRLTGFTATECHLQNVCVQDCLADSARFRFATFRSVVFEKCDLSGADFQSADLSGVIFQKCNLAGAHMSGAKLVGTDLRGSNIENIRVGVAELPGAIVDHFQAAYIASLLGVVIKDEYDTE